MGEGGKGCHPGVWGPERARSRVSAREAWSEVGGRRLRKRVRVHVDSDPLMRPAVPQGGLQQQVAPGGFQGGPSGLGTGGSSLRSFQA